MGSVYADTYESHTFCKIIWDQSIQICTDPILFAKPYEICRGETHMDPKLYMQVHLDPILLKTYTFVQQP